MKLFLPCFTRKKMEFFSRKKKKYFLNFSAISKNTNGNVNRSMKRRQKQIDKLVK
jgi:glutaredoxin 2